MRLIAPSQNLRAWPFAAALATACLFAAAPAVRAAGPDAKLYQTTVDKGVDFLAHSQGEDGSFSRQGGVGITAIAVTSLLQNGRTVDDPVVAKGLKFMEKFVRKDGGIYTDIPGVDFRNYETSIAVMCLVAANKDKRYDKQIKNAEQFLRDIQWTEKQGTKKEDTNYGGAGYGKSRRPDLSNTTFMIDALRAAGNAPDSEAIQKALVFVKKCQNFEDEQNPTPAAGKNPDGSFFYTAADGGSSPANKGKGAEGGLRGYGSMTYSGLKSMIYAGVNANDPRVKAAVKWASMNYDLETNPGMGAEGLYYYYHTFAKANSAMKVDEITDGKGVKHDWRKELVEALAKHQQENGSWVNKADRWMESDPNLATSFALLALSYCKPEVQK